MARKGARVEVIGLPELEAALEQAAEETRAAAKAAVDEELDEIATEMRRDAPEKTGDLRRSIKAHPELDEVRASERYAWYVEHGTSSTRAQPFAGPAADRARIRAPRRITDAVKAAVGRLKT